MPLLIYENLFAEKKINDLYFKIKPNNKTIPEKSKNILKMDEKKQVRPYPIPFLNDAAYHATAYWEIPAPPLFLIQMEESFLLVIWNNCKNNKKN